ncbi:MAG: SPOR domain-containing protein [Chitinispirillia bacterium]|nr:SPOR domain-containing protein [Chitinispirillia bacterium]MCL2242018.1 SPOR domain-containing protein [Chitinispirillia bacterium]
MKRVLLVMTAPAALALLLTACCTPKAANTGHGGPSADGPSALPDPSAQYSPSGDRTFLDTLNQGKEIALTAGDLPALEVAAVNPAAASGGLAGEAAQGPRFRIQILASSQVDMVRKAKVEAEATVNLPAFMASEQSLYKLYVGDFKTKQEAEAALPDVKKKGYTDAWVVNVRAQ